MVGLAFDLVVAVAITQRCLVLLAHPDFIGPLRTVVRLLTVWSFWIDACGVTNWLGPKRLPLH